MTSRCWSKQAAAVAGYTLLELVLAGVLVSTVAAIFVSQLKPDAGASRQRACDALRQLLQTHAEQHFRLQGRWPSRSLSELTTAEYLNKPLPACPCRGGSYEMSGAIVVCPTHEPTRR